MSGDDQSSTFEIKVDLLGFLANNLRGYEPTSILREQLQNADDACRKQGRTGELRMEFLPDRLVVTNPSVFDRSDWRRLINPSSRGKFLEADQTGEFGVGFWGSLHLTDAPKITSGTVEAILNPVATQRNVVPAFDGTRVEFPYRRQGNDLSEALDAGVITTEVEDAMADTFVGQMAELLLFTQAITSIRIDLRDGSQRRATRTVEQISPGIERLAVHVAEAPEQDCEYLIVRTEVPDPPKGRHGRITVALPLTGEHQGPGRVFFMFPTDTDSGLNLSIDAHFRATDDRRSLENSGEHGEWNARVFAAAGSAVGRSIERVLDPDVHRLDYETAVSWFADTGDHLPEIKRRSQLFLEALDQEAKTRRVIPDRTGELRRSDELIRLPDAIESILSDAIENTAAPTDSPVVAEVFNRWGLLEWGPAHVASWLYANVPHHPISKAEAPGFMAKPSHALSLLAYCQGQEARLQGLAMLLATDQTYYPIGGSVAKPTDALRHLVEGLGQPIVDQSFLSSIAARYAPTTTPQWFQSALLESADQLVGMKVGSRKAGVSKNQQHVAEALDILHGSRLSLDGIPLAMDEEAVLHAFGDATVVGLPHGTPRKAAEALARRLGLQPVHAKIDDQSVAQAAQRFSPSYIVELIPSVRDWDPVRDTKLLVEVLAAVAQVDTISPHLVETLRALPIWQASDGKEHRLHELWLPARQRVTASSRLLVADSLLGSGDATDPVFSTLHRLLEVQVLDPTEEVVIACEDPPPDPDDLRSLLIELADCPTLSPQQKARLRSAKFVPGRDGQARSPDEILLTTDRLPLWLEGACVDPVGQDRKVRARLEQLGAVDLPAAAELLDVAAEIATLPVSKELAEDPGRILWDHLQQRFDDYERGTLGELASIAWLVASPGRTRRRPRECFDPALSFASGLFPVPHGVATIPGRFRDALKIRATLETEDCVRLGKKSAAEGTQLAGTYFAYLNRRVQRDARDERLIGSLRTEALVPLSTGLTAPDRLVSRARAAVWGHLRDLVPENFVSEYPNLLRAWAIDSEGAAEWQEHLDVLEELAALDEVTERDRALARERIMSLVPCADNEAQLATIHRRGHLVTTVGLRPCADTLLGDLHPSVLNRLGQKVPIVEESDAIAPLVEALSLRSLRSEVDLDPLVEAPKSDGRWPSVLRVHRANVLRFLKASGTRLDHELIDSWPPIVQSVSSLSVRATWQGEVIDEWPAEAHLSEADSEAVLYVCGSSLDASSVVDAISYAFGVDRGKKSLLLNVLQSRSAEEGSGLLDWENIPALGGAEAEYLYVHEDTVLVFTDEGDDQTLPDDDVEVDVDVDVDVEFGDSSPVAYEPQDTEETSTDAGPEAIEDADSPDITLELEEESPTAPTLETSTDPSPVSPIDPDDRPQSPRGVTDLEELQAAGIRVVRDLEQDVADSDYRPEPSTSDDEVRRNEVRACLSFFDVSNGYIPVTARDVAWLCSGVAVREVILFGESVKAQLVGAKHLKIEGGPALFHSRQVVPGTVVRLYPSVPGTIEVAIRPDLHRIDGVWMLEFDEDGLLNRLVQDDIELQWETDDGFYRAERRLEDIEALMADGGKSAVQLVTEVFLGRPDEGLTVDEIWGLVAISRLFAKATIAQTLSTQSGLFSYEDGLWYKVGDELRMARAPQRERGPRSSTPRKATPEVIKLARKLAQLLASADREVLEKVVQLLGITDLLGDQSLIEATKQYLRDGDASVLRAIEAEMRDDIGRSVVVIAALEDVETDTLSERRELVELIRDAGSAASVSRANALLNRIDALTGGATVDPVERVRQLLTTATVDQALLCDAVEAMWAARRPTDPLDDPNGWLEDLTVREFAHRQATRQGELEDRATAARGSAIGWLNAQLPAPVYDEPALQRLRVVLDLVKGESATDVLDGLHQLALLAEQSPDGAGDSALLYALLLAHARATGLNTSRLVDRSKKQVKKLATSPSPGKPAEEFADLWCDLARLPMTDVLKTLQQASA